VIALSKGGENHEVGTKTTFEEGTMSGIAPIVFWTSDWDDVVDNTTLSSDKGDRNGGAYNEKEIVVVEKTTVAEERVSVCEADVMSTDGVSK